MQWSIIKHRGKWAIRLADGRKFSTGIDWGQETRERAEEAAEQFCRQLQVRDAESVEDIVSAYAADMTERTSPVIDPKRISYAWKNLCSYFGSGLKPDQVDRTLCRRYIRDRRSAGASDWTIRREIGCVRSALNWADPQNTAAFELPPKPKPRDRFLTRSEVDKLIAAVDPRGQNTRCPHLWVFIHVALATQGRKEAILELRWDQHIDFDRGTVWLGFKEGGKGRARVPMTDTLRDVLELAREMAVSDYVIEYAGKRVGDVKRGLRSAYTRAGLADVPNPAHVLRHTGAVWLAESGASMALIAQRLGHSDSRITEEVYARFSPEGLKASNAVLEIGS